MINMIVSQPSKKGYERPVLRVAEFVVEEGYVMSNAHDAMLFESDGLRANDAGNQYQTLNSGSSSWGAFN